MKQNTTAPFGGNWLHKFFRSGKGHANKRTERDAVDARRAFVLVMGPTGAGKSTFINIATNSELRVGDSVMSCTETIQHSLPVLLDGREVILVDTPGFDDSKKSDVEILTVLCEFLAAEYRQGVLLQGVVYLYRISDNKAPGSAVRNLRLYENLCGEDALCNSIVVTNMWNRVDEAVGSAREEQLKNEPTLLKPILDRGAKLMRHHGTQESAHEILRQLLVETPQPLRIQRELFEEGKALHQTVAGQALLESLAIAQQRYLDEMQQLEEDMADALREKDEEAARELEEERRKIQMEEDKLNEQERRLQEMRMTLVAGASRAQEVSSSGLNVAPPANDKPPSSPQKQVGAGWASVLNSFSPRRHASEPKPEKSEGI